MNDKPTRVLIVEGDADEALIVGSYLADAPDRAETYVLTQAPRFSTACHLLAQQSFDVVLLDLVLPQSVGLESFRKIHELKPLIPIIVLTGLQDVPLAIQAVKLGAHDYFIKGSPDCCLIKRAIRYALEKKRLTDAIEDLLGASDAPKLVIDSDSVVRYANAAAQSVFGRAPEEMVNKTFGHPLPDGDGETAIPAPKSPEMVLGLRVRWISWNGAPARLVTLRDAASSEQLKRLQAEIKEGLRVVAVKNHFMSHISHELRNSLATLTTAAYCLKDGPAGSLTPRQLQLVDMISRNVARQTKIIENVLDLARFQSGKLKIQFNPVDVSAIIAQIVEECGLGASAPKLRIDVDDRLPVIDGDPELIAQVLRNLIDNALRSAKETVVVAAAKEGPDGVSVSVVDDGAGIPPDRLGELFSEFVQLERKANGNGSRANGYKGTGLGLTICKEIVEGHNGKIWAENAPGRGARFSFTLPIRNASVKGLLQDDRVYAASGGPASARASNGDGPSYSGHK
jgi:signal transduction histidine kinase/DNA-binding NarL/FixJ family response regulator